MERLIENIARALVDAPDQVSVDRVEGERGTVLNLRVAPEDVGRLVGRQGRTARSLRTVLSAASSKANLRCSLEIVE